MLRIERRNVEGPGCKEMAFDERSTPKRLHQKRLFGTGRQLFQPKTALNTLAPYLIQLIAKISIL